MREINKLAVQDLNLWPSLLSQCCSLTKERFELSHTDRLLYRTELTAKLFKMVARAEIWTSDFPIMSRLLYQLS
jgi:hypothetical protein